MQELVLFGVTGDLAKQKLIPALFNLYRTGKVSKKSSFIGFGRKKFTKADFQNFIEEVLLKHVHQALELATIRDFSSQWSYVESELDNPAGYKKLSNLLTTDTTIVYLSLPPMFQYSVSHLLISSGILAKKVNRKLAIEKPYGFNSASSLELEGLLTRKLKANQILRVDHYAGKQALVELEQVAHQGIFENIFHVKNFNKIQVNFIESIDVSMRGSFYDGVGALSDVGQNHVLHMLATILALPELKTNDLDSKDLKDLATLRAEALSLVCIKNEKAKPILAQYMGFNTTPGVRPDSKTETFFRVFAEIKKGKGVLAKRWGGLQIELVGGKALGKSDSSIVLQAAHKSVMHKTASHKKSMHKNGSDMQILVNRYGKSDAYEQIFIDAFYYDKNRFIDFEQIQRGWKIIEKVKKLSKSKSTNKTYARNLIIYKRGSYPQDIF